MKTGCIDADELSRMLDGQVSVARTEAIRRHTEACTVCRAELDAQRELLADLAAPIAGVATAAILDHVQNRLDGGARARPAHRVRWLVGAGAACGVVIAALALAPRFADRAKPDAAEPVARAGGIRGALSREVGVTIYALAAEPRRLADGSTIHPDTPLMLGYRNLRVTAPVYLLVFAIDVAGTVHWLMPGFLDPRQDPAALALSAATRETALPESVVLDAPAPGRLRIVSVASPIPLRVSAIEGQPPPALEVGALRRRWPGAAIDELIVEVAPGGGQGR